MKFLAVKTMGHALKPAFDSDLEKVKKMKVGETYSIEVKKPRNVAHHRKFFALINLTFENQEIYDNIDFMRSELTKAAGFYDHYLNHLGISCYVSKSISFANMDQFDFDIMYNKFLDIIIKVFKFDRDTIEDELVNFF
jgi:Protein of unknown function (DUF1367)